MNKTNKAAELFNKGFNCSQAVFSAYSEELGLDTETALKIAQGFGAGMGRLQHVCGAVTGAFMALSLKYGSATAGDIESKEKIYGLVREFTKRFKARNKTIICKDLLEVDLINGDKKLNAVKVQDICPILVRDAVEILKDLENLK